MYKPDKHRPYAAKKARLAQRERFPIRVSSNWTKDVPPVCTIHGSVAVWHRNRARESGGQWACRDCARLKSTGQRRHWKTGHTDPFTYNLKRLFTMAKCHSRKVGRQFDLSFDDLLALWNSQNGKCAVSGQDMDYFPGDGSRRRNKITMDRIDSTLGYTRGNVWLVCDWVNRAKSDLTIDELHLFARGITTNLPRVWPQTHFQT